jgi:hypothetical protein
VSNHLIGGIEWTGGASGFDVGKAFCKPGVNHSTLLRRRIVTRPGECPFHSLDGSVGASKTMAR